MKPTPEQEQVWAEHREACYRKWREEKLSACVAWVTAARDDWQRNERLASIRQRLGKPGKGFMNELWRRLEV